jgi:uncharacterized protein
VARAAIGAQLEAPMTAASAVEGRILSDACRWYAFRVLSLDDSQERTRIECRVVEQGRVRDFFGFNRGKHAVIEAAILATRVRFLPAEEILAQFERLEPLVQKTGGPAEHRAFALLREYIHASRVASAPRGVPDNRA